MSTELDEAMNAIPDLSEDHIITLVQFQISELAKYNAKGTRTAKKDQSEEDVQAALAIIVGEQPKAAPVSTGFKRRF
jgi:hypothetical protein